MVVRQISPSDVFSYLREKRNIVAIDFGFSKNCNDLALYNCQQRRVAEVANLLTDEGNLFFLVESETDDDTFTAKGDFIIYGKGKANCCPCK